jgi:hypothetical protein
VGELPGVLEVEAVDIILGSDFTGAKRNGQTGRSEGSR